MRARKSTAAGAARYAKIRGSVHVTHVSKEGAPQAAGIRAAALRAHENAIAAAMKARQQRRQKEADRDTPQRARGGECNSVQNYKRGEVAHCGRGAAHCALVFRAYAIIAAYAITLVFSGAIRCCR